MARRRYARAAKALTQLSKGKQETQFNQLASQNIRAGTEAAVESMNKKFAMAGQAMVTADALVQGYKTKGKIEKGVTSLAEAKGGDVSYKKTGLGDIFRGEAKLSEWGKESWDIGGDKYDRADVLAFEEKGRKDLKWESVIGKELTTMDDEGGVSTERKKVKPREPKDYKIQGEAALFGMEGMEKKYGKGWSYSKQKAIGKLSDAERAGGGAQGILQQQVAANVGASNYSTISKAFKKEYAGQEKLMSDIKTLDLKHEAFLQHQGSVKKQGTDEVSGVIKSAKAVQTYGSGQRSPLEIAPNIKNAKIAGKSVYTEVPDQLDASKLLGGRADELSSTAEAASKSIDRILASDRPTSYQNPAAKRPGGSAVESPEGFFSKPTAENQYESDKKWREQRASEDANILSTAKTMQAEHEKVRGEVSSLTSGDDYVSPNDPSLSEGGMYMDEWKKTRRDEGVTTEGVKRDENNRVIDSLNQLDFDAPGMDKDSDFINESGQTLADQPKFTNMGGTMRTQGYSQTTDKSNPMSYTDENPYRPEGSPEEFTGTADQNINLLNTVARDTMYKQNPRSALSDTFDFNTATSGGYDTEPFTFGEPKPGGEFAGQYTTYDEQGGVIPGLHEGKNYYSGVNLRGKNVKDTWKALGLGGWDDRKSLWNSYMDSAE